MNLFHFIPSTDYMQRIPSSCFNESDPHDEQPKASTSVESPFNPSIIKVTVKIDILTYALMSRQCAGGFCCD